MLQFCMMVRAALLRKNPTELGIYVLTHSSAEYLALRVYERLSKFDSREAERITLPH